MGIVTGMSASSYIDIWSFNGVKVNGKQLFFWMDSYCKKNPLGDTLSGAIVFADERTNGAYSKSR
jgi:hypothetical protein